MKENYFTKFFSYGKILIIGIFLLSCIHGMAQTTNKSVLARYSISSKKLKDTIVDKDTTSKNVLKKSSVNTTMKKNTGTSNQKLKTPQLKRVDRSPMKKEDGENLDKTQK